MKFDPHLKSSGRVLLFFLMAVSLFFLFHGAHDQCGEIFPREKNEKQETIGGVIGVLTNGAGQRNIFQSTLAIGDILGPCSGLSSARFGIRRL